LLILIGGISLAVSASVRHRYLEVFRDSRLRWIAWPFAAWFLSNLLVAALASTPWSKVFPGNAFRFVLALTLLCFAAEARSRRWLIASLPVAALAAFLHGTYELWVLHVPHNRAYGFTNNAIHFGNLSALVMLLSISAAMLARDGSTRLRVVLVLAAGLAGFAAISSGARSSALAFLCLLPLVFFQYKDFIHRLIAVALVLAFSLSAIAVSLSPEVKERIRIAELQQDIRQTTSNNFDTATGQRFIMWRSAWLLFKEHPLTGVGPGNFTGEFKKLVQEGVIPPVAVFNQPHSDILHAASAGGSILLAAYFAIMLGPWIYFCRRYRQLPVNSTPKMLSVFGMQVVGAYFLFGLTNSGFDLQIYSTTYSVLICVLAAMTRVRVTPI
jgi:O-antigen ligase